MNNFAIIHDVENIMHYYNKNYCAAQRCSKALKL